MAKKNWLDVAEDITVGTAVNMIIPGGAAVYAVGKAVYDNLSSDDESDDTEDVRPNNVVLAIEAFNNEDYEEALEYLEAAHANNEIRPFLYYRLTGKCHYCLMDKHRTEYWEKAEELGLTEDTDEDDSRWEQIAHIKEKTLEEQSLANDSLKESLNHKVEGGDFVADPEMVAGVFWLLAGVCNSRYEQRRYDMAAMACDSLRKDAKQEYNSVTQDVLKWMDESFTEMKEIETGCLGGEPLSDEDKEFLLEGAKDGLFSRRVDYHERQFIYVAKNVDALAGCYDDNIQWLFTIDGLPKELQFPVGHPQPNSLYYAHPAKPGVYLPIEGADEELFYDKVRDFQRLAQCLGATEISFRSVKGHSLSENIATGLDIEVGGDYKGVGGSMGYGNKRGNGKSQSSRGEKEMFQRYNPTKAPYIPNDIGWMAVDPEWQSLVKQRLEGNMLHYSIRISSRKTMAVSDSRMDDVKLAFKSFIANAHVNYSQQMERSFEREEETEWEISVTFKPLEELNNMGQQVLNVEVVESTTEQPNLPQYTANEKEYIDSLRDFLEDDAEITPRERKMLDKIRVKLGISEERAQELEASLAKSQLTEDEQEYLDMYREYAEKGEVTEKERRRLDKFANALGLSKERVKEIEGLN